MKLAAGAVVVLAVGAGLGTYFALRGPSAPEVPKAQQSAVLEQAMAEGVIDGYRVRRFERDRPWEYEAAGANIHFRGDGRAYCGGENSRPACLAVAQRFLPMLIEYQRRAATQAQAILRIAQAQFPNATIKFFEITTPGG
jgi:hypothetical protein